MYNICVYSLALGRRVPMVEKTLQYSDLMKLKNYIVLNIAKLYDFFQNFQPARILPAG